MTIEITEEILKALLKATKGRGKQIDLVKKSGVDQATISRLTNGKLLSIEIGTWLKLYPHIENFLPERYGDNIFSGGVNHGVLNQTQGESINNTDLISRKELINKVVKSVNLDAETKLIVVQIINE